MNTRKLISGFIGFAVLAVVIRLCVYTVPADQFVVITDFGKPKAIHSDPGLYYKWPAPFSLTNRIDKKLQSYQTPLVEYLTGDKKNLLIQAYIFWRIRDPLVFFQAIHNIESATQKLDDVVCSLVASTLGEYGMNQIISTEKETIQIKSILDRVTSSARTRIESYGIDISYVGFSRIALPDDNTRSVYRRMIAERSTIANEYQSTGSSKSVGDSDGGRPGAE